jgi:N-acetylglucosaminyldiphosphoundecaprenol N-acetyl-beta-D-mannosaminyltransferase
VASAADSPAEVDSVAAEDRAAAAAVSVSPPPDRLEILGIAVDSMRRSDIERRIAAHLAYPGTGLLHIATINPEYVVAAQRDPSFRVALARTDLAAPDGVGIIAAARVLCTRKIERITGVDLVESLFSISSAELPRIFLLGNAASIAELQGRHPLRVVGRWGSGTTSAADDPESIERIRERSANVVVVGYGAPGQIIWIERNREALENVGVKVAIGVGGALDYLSETVDRAPRIVQRFGFEWLYRLVREPWRWRRQLALPIFTTMVVHAWAIQRLRGNGCPCRILARDEASNRTCNQ